MKNLIIAILVLITCSQLLIAQSDEVIVPYNPVTMTKGLKININVGNIIIKGTERKDILVNYSFKQEPVTDLDQVSSEGLKRISIGKSSLNIQTLNDVVLIGDSDYSNELELYIEVPNQISISSYKGGPGTLNISNITGNLNLENNSGSIIATEINGLVNASTNEGSIKIEFKSLATNYDIILANLMGDIEVKLPSMSNVSFHMKTNRGDLLTNLNLQMKEAPMEAPTNANASEGFSYENNTWTTAILNAGGPSMTISSMNGNIILRGY